MHDPSHEQVVEAYLSHARGVSTDAADKSLSWAYDAVHDLVHDDPETLWIVLQAIVARCDDDRTLAYVAAGPVEELICEHGPRFIDRIEIEAASSPRFLRALTGVWGRNRIEADVQSRLYVLVKDQSPW